MWTHFVEAERPALQQPPAGAFPLFQTGERTLHADGYVEVAGAFYSVPLPLPGARVRVQWDAPLVRVYAGDALWVVHHVVRVGTYARASVTRQRPFASSPSGRCGTRHPRKRVLAEVTTALAQQHFHHQTIRTRTEAALVTAPPLPNTTDPAIRSMDQYTLDHFLP